MTTFLRMSLTAILAALLAAAFPPSLQPQKDARAGKQSRFFITASIGVPEAKKDEDKPYMFSSIISADFDAEGNTYVLDWKEGCVKVFDRSGRFRNRFLSPGQGPGEAQKPFRLRVSPDGNRVFILHLNGFQIKEFNASGNFVSTHSLPKQMLDYFDFLDGDRLLFVDRIPYGQKISANLKVFAVREQNFVKELALTSTDFFTGFQRFVVRNGMIWTCPGDLMELHGYDLESGARKKIYTLPEKYIPSQNILWGENIQKTRVWNYAQPFECAGILYIIVTRQQFSREPRDMMDAPLRREITLYRLDGDRLVKEPDFPTFDFYPEFHSARNSRILISSSPYDLYPRLVVLELH
jgi:hypothetical protein